MESSSYGINWPHLGLVFTFDVSISALYLYDDTILSVEKVENLFIGRGYTPWPCCRMFDYDIFIEFNEFVNTNIAFDSKRNENKHCNSTELCLSYLYRSPLFLSSLFFIQTNLCGYRLELSYSYTSTPRQLVLDRIHSLGRPSYAIPFVQIQ